MSITIGIGTLNDNTKQFYNDTLNEIIGDLCTIRAYNINNVKKKLIDVDIFLMSTPLMINMVKKYLKPSTVIIPMKRTLTKKSYDRLKTIATNEKVYLVNNGIDVTFEAISLIYSLGFNFELYPFYPGITPMTEIKSAITTNEIQLIPESVETIYNIGHMVFDMSTILELINHLPVDEEIKDQRLNNYLNKIVTLDKGVNTLIDSNLYIQQEKNAIINLITEGVVETDNMGRIILVNEASEKILESDILIGKDILTLLPDLSQYINENKYVNELLINYGNDKLIVSIKPIDVFTEKVGNIIILRNVTEIKRLEEKVRKSSNVSGYVAKYDIEDIIGQSQKITEVRALARKMAGADSTILITGESGSGKELFAQAIHNASKRKNFPFLAINCATLPENLVESELFGYESGAFTGAKKEGKLGLFEQAHLGTLFFDEIAELSMRMQSRLLRVLQESEIIRIGSNKIRTVDVRIIVATNENLYSLAQKGLFRWDLFYRLNIFPLNIPPLRERKKDIPLLFNYFLEKLNCQKEVKPDLIDLFTAYHWPGNIRELENIAEYVSFMSDDIIDIMQLPYSFQTNIVKPTKQQNLSDKHHAILECLKTAYVNHQKIGRKSLTDALIPYGYYVTEREIRNELISLQKNDLVSIGSGRQGTQITQKGLDLCYLSDVSAK